MERCTATNCCSKRGNSPGKVHVGKSNVILCVSSEYLRYVRAGPKTESPRKNIKTAVIEYSFPTWFQRTQTIIFKTWFKPRANKAGFRAFAHGSHSFLELKDLLCQQRAPLNALSAAQSPLSTGHGAMAEGACVECPSLFQLSPFFLLEIKAPSHSYPDSCGVHLTKAMPLFSASHSEKLNMLALLFIYRLLVLMLIPTPMILMPFYNFHRIQLRKYPSIWKMAFSQEKANSFWV